MEAEEVVGAPPDRVWQVVADPKNLPAWDRHIVRISGAPSDGLAKGSTYSVHLSFLGARAKADATVLDIDPPRHSVVRLDGVVDAMVETWIEPVGKDRSRLRHRIEYRFPGGHLGSLAAQGIRMLGGERLLRRGVQAQKRQAESAG
jgi:carbon monoxide dehydrogenase subunit G